MISLSVVNVYAFFNQNKSQKIRIYGEDIILSTSYIDSDGKMYIPVREFFELKGDTVIWREDEQIVEIRDTDGSDISPNLKDTIYENFEKHLQVSEEGILENGQKYEYIAPCDFIDPTHEIDYEQFFKDMGRAGGNGFLWGVVRDAKTAVEIFRDILKLEYNEKISYDVIYDFKHNVWVVVEDFNGNIFSRGPQGIAIRKYDGKVLGSYGDGLPVK